MQHSWVLLAMVLSLSCKTRLLDQSVPMKPATKGLSLADDGTETFQRPLVLSTWLLSKDLQIDNFQANTQSFIGFSVPVISITLPTALNSSREQVVISDYIEIYRCPEHAKIMGDRSESLDEVLDKSTDLDQLIESFRLNNFWPKIAKTQGCVLVAPNHSDTLFYDIGYRFDPANPLVRYYAHACVDPSRIVQPGQASSGHQPNCSVAIASSNAYRGSKSFSDSQLQKLQETASIKDRIDFTSRQLSYLLLDLRPKALKKCEEENNTSYESESQKNSRTTLSWIVGSTSSFAGYLTYKSINHSGSPRDTPAPPVSQNLRTSERIRNFGSTFTKTLPATVLSAAVSTSAGYILSAIIGSLTPSDVKYPNNSDLCDVDAERKLAEKTLADAKQVITAQAVSTNCSCAQTTALDSIIADLEGRLETDTIEFQNYLKNVGAKLENSK